MADALLDALTDNTGIKGTDKIYVAVDDGVGGFTDSDATLNQLKTWIADSADVFTETGVDGAGTTAVITMDTDAKTAADGVALDFQAHSSTDVNRIYGRVEFRITDPTNTSEDADMYMDAMIGGTLTNVLRSNGADIEIPGGLTIASDLTLASGSITSASGAIDFGNENLSTTGTLAAGATTVTGTLDVSSGGTNTALSLTSSDTRVGISFSDNATVTVTEIIGVGDNLQLEVGGNPFLTGDGSNQSATFAGDVTLSAGDLIIATATTPASAGATGTQGTIAWDASYLYVCVATDTWKRIGISTW